MSNSSLSLRKDQDPDQGGSIALNESQGTQDPIVDQAAASLTDSAALGDQVFAKGLKVQKNLQDKGTQAVALVQAEVESQIASLRKTTADGRVAIDEASLSAEVELEEADEASKATQMKVQAGFDALVKRNNDWLASMKERADAQQAQADETFRLLAEQIVGTKMSAKDLLEGWE